MKALSRRYEASIKALRRYDASIKARGFRPWRESRKMYATSVCGLKLLVYEALSY
jgi:hypothetical protein